MQRFSKAAFVVGSLSLFGTFGCLAALFANDQFEFQYVFSHGDSLTEMKYKIAGVWSGQQGSFLLWACTSAVFGLLALWRTGVYQRWFIAGYAAFLGCLCGILAYETPFAMMEGVVHAGQVLQPSRGNGLAPSLQNYWVVVHPPTIFLGFGSLTVLFCFALSALLNRNFKDWVPLVRPWALVSVAVLGLGISMGGLWAYETLGWGGFWAWDPVENASFVPWLFVVAFTHGLIVQASRNRWIATNLLLGGLPFVTFVYGTFLTRSGFLSEASVHSFAEMNRSALWILLALLAISALGFAGLWIARYKQAKEAESPIASGAASREILYKMGVMLLSLLGLSVAIGMSVPFFMAIAGKPSKVVEEGLYHLVVVWFFIPIMLLVAAGPFATWRGMGWQALSARLFNVLCLAVGITGGLVMILKNPRVGVNPDYKTLIHLPFGKGVPLMPWMSFLIFLCVFALIANLWRIGEMSRRSKVFSLGGFVAHLGFAVLMAGLIFSRGFERKEQVIAQQNTSGTALDYVLTPTGLQAGRDLSDRNGKLEVEMQGPGQKPFTATPGLYWLPPDESGKQNTQRWPYIRRWFSHDLYLALGDPILTMWPEPIQLKPGETNKNPVLSLTYLGMERKGQPGKAGTQFIANMKLASGSQTFNVKPALTIGNGRPEAGFVEAGPQFLVTILGMDAATKSVVAQVYFKQPFYPMELYYKPLTSLVWIGTGILTLGGLMSVVHRRTRRRNDAGTVEETVEDSADTINDDALVSAT